MRDNVRGLRERKLGMEKGRGGEVESKRKAPLRPSTGRKGWTSMNTREQKSKLEPSNASGQGEAGFQSGFELGDDSSG